MSDDERSLDTRNPIATAVSEAKSDLVRVTANAVDGRLASLGDVLAKVTSGRGSLKVRCAVFFAAGLVALGWLVATFPVGIGSALLAVATAATGFFGVRDLLDIRTLSKLVPFVGIFKELQEKSRGNDVLRDYDFGVVLSELSTTLAERRLRGKPLETSAKILKLKLDSAVDALQAQSQLLATLDDPNGVVDTAELMRLAGTRQMVNVMARYERAVAREKSDSARVFDTGTLTSGGTTVQVAATPADGAASPDL